MRAPTLLGAYAAMLREEPRARAYLLASLVDDVGVALSAWASALLFAGLAVTQRERASFMMPTLASFLAGSLFAGPLADWAARESPLALARWRWKVVLVGRLVETAFLGLMVALLATGAATVPRVLPYLLVSAFSKTLLRATRLAYTVDLLEREAPQHAPDGSLARDERGAPLRFKTHLVAFTSATSFFASGASIAGFLLGRRIMGAVHEKSWVLFLADVLTNVLFVAIVARYARPHASSLEPGGGRDADVQQSTERAPVAERPRATEPGLVAHVRQNVTEGVRFLASKPQRPLLALLASALLVEVVSETYDGPMIVLHGLHAGPEGVRRAALVWKLVGALGALIAPLLVRRVGSLGRTVLLAMLLDGAVIALAGHVARAGVATAAGAFVAVLAVDHLLTFASSTLVTVAQNSVSSAAMRGRIAATYATAVLVGDLAAEALATVASERWGLAGMLVRVGGFQVTVVLALTLAGGRRLWRFGLDDRAHERA